MYRKPTIGNAFARAFAVAIALWWGGLNCLAGCGLLLPALSHDSSHISDEPVAECCQKSHCETPSTGTISSPTLQTVLESDSRHRLCPYEDVLASFPRQQKEVGTETVVALNVFESNTREIVRSAWLDASTHLPDRGGTHLRCCVFRI